MAVSNRDMLMIAAAALGAALTGSPAKAQATRPTTPQIVPEERQDRSGRQDEAEPQQGTSSAPSGSLSSELSRSGGVVRPPSTGDQGVVAPPSAGAQSTPVIPPPGTPGGNQEIQPK